MSELQRMRTRETVADGWYLTSRSILNCNFVYQSRYINLVYISTFCMVKVYRVSSLGWLRCPACQLSAVRWQRGEGTSLAGWSPLSGCWCWCWCWWRKDEVTQSVTAAGHSPAAVHQQNTRSSNTLQATTKAFGVLKSHSYKATCYFAIEDKP